MKEKIQKHKCKILGTLFVLLANGTGGEGISYMRLIQTTADTTIKIINAVKPTASSEDGMNDAGFIRYRQINENSPDTIKASTTK